MSDAGNLQPTKAEIRSQAQRERILAAAESCFVHSGFHAASMAMIAETAGMSPGLIYRYFDNKNAIILAIIDKQLEVARRKIGEMHASRDLVTGIIEHFDEHDTGNDHSMSAPLFLEMSAEASREPQIAEAVGRFDTTVRAELAEWLGRSKALGGYGLSPEITTERAFLLVCLIEGLKVRKAREPGLDRALLRRALDTIIGPLLSPDGRDGDRTLV